MKISVIQSKQYVLYDVNDPGEYTVEKCFAGRDKSVAEVLRLTREAAEKGADMIVTTEAFNASIFPGDPRYDFMTTAEPLDGPIVQQMQAIASEHETYIVAGLFTIREGKVYNTALLINPSGVIQGMYDKTHLTIGELSQVTPGEAYPIFETEFGNVGMLICWDMQYPEAVREIALAGADLIACPTWGWENIYGLSRAYENSVTIAAANNLPPHGEVWEWCNPAMIVDNMGKILAEAPMNDIGIATAEVDIRREPDLQYFVQGNQSMRQLRSQLRRPETYKLLNMDAPPLMDRWS